MELQRHPRFRWTMSQSRMKETFRSTLPRRHGFPNLVWRSMCNQVVLERSSALGTPLDEKLLYGVVNYGKTLQAPR